MILHTKISMSHRGVPDVIILQEIDIELNIHISASMSCHSVCYCFLTRSADTLLIVSIYTLLTSFHVSLHCVRLAASPRRDNPLALRRGYIKVTYRTRWSKSEFFSRLPTSFDKLPRKFASTDAPWWKPAERRIGERKAKWPRRVQRLQQEEADRSWCQGRGWLIRRLRAPPRHPGQWPRRRPVSAAVNCRCRHPIFSSSTSRQPNRPRTATMRRTDRQPAHRSPRSRRGANGGAPAGAPSRTGRKKRSRRCSAVWRLWGKGILRSEALLFVALNILLTDFRSPSR